MANKLGDLVPGTLVMLILQNVGAGTHAWVGIAPPNRTDEQRRFSG